MKSMVKVSKSLKPTLDFRRSVSKDKISTPIETKVPPPSILPPKKVIKALYDYAAKGQKELSFSKGDFFHVVDNENDPNWYEACNPATNVRGLVPVSYFQVLEKSSRFVDDKADSGNTLDGPKPQPLYGIVLYDFVAERPDELDAKAGEPIIVIAQSNHEWFVAKPIGRLGGPGLIPVSFIEIRDHATGKAIENIQELMDKSIVPKVEEWKKMTKDYQANSISLGRLDSKLAPIGIDPKLAPMALVDQNLAPVSLDYDPKLAPVSLDYDQNFAPGPPDHDPKLAPVSSDYDSKLAPVSSDYDQDVAPVSYDNNNNNNNYTSSGLHDSVPLEYYDYSQDEPLDTSDNLPINSDQQFGHYDSGTVPNDEDIISASVESFHFEDGRFWFLVRVELFSGCFRLLYRLYEDFYEFQITLLEKFPDEAGRNGDQRILPFMPGPLSYVNEVITAQRRADLDTYVKELLRLPPYILKDPLIDQLFGLRDGDIETPNDPRQPMGANGNTSDPDPLPPMLTYPANHTPITSQQSKKLPPPLSGSGYNKHNTSSSSTSQSFIRSPRVHDESSNNNSQLFSPSAISPHSENKQTFMKIKISYKDDKIAIRVPSDVTYAQLREKICDRLGERVSSLSYRDEKTNEVNPLEDDDDLNNALDTCPKLLIYAA